MAHTHCFTANQLHQPRISKDARGNARICCNGATARHRDCRPGSNFGTWVQRISQSDRQLLVPGCSFQPWFLRVIASLLCSLDCQQCLAPLHALLAVCLATQKMKRQSESPHGTLALSSKFLGWCKLWHNGLVTRALLALRLLLFEGPHFGSSAVVLGALPCCRRSFAVDGTVKAAVCC